MVFCLCLIEIFHQSCNTRHWNDDLKQIIEQGGTNHKFKYIDGCAYKMAQIKIICPVLFWLDQNCRFSYSKIDFYLESFFSPKNSQFYYKKIRNLIQSKKPWSYDFHFGHFTCTTFNLLELMIDPSLFNYFLEIIIAMRGVPLLYALKFV